MRSTRSYPLVRYLDFAPLFGGVAPLQNFRMCGTIGAIAITDHDAWIRSTTNFPTSSSTDYHLVDHPKGKSYMRSLYIQILRLQFRGIFRLSQVELRELRKQLNQLLKDGKVESPRPVPTEHRSFLQRRRMVAFECVSITAR